MKFRKKPVVIEAIQFLGVVSFDEMAATWGDTFVRVCSFFAGSTDVNMDMTIKTLEGDHQALIGDWIIRGVKGEFYPCKNDIFEMTYDLVRE